MTNSKNFWIAGKHSVLAALNNKDRIVEEVLIAKENMGLIGSGIKKINKQTKFRLSEKSSFRNLFKDRNIIHQNIAAKIKPLKSIKLKDALSSMSKVVMLDNVTDARNVGSIIRSCVAFNVEAIIVKQRSFENTSALMFKSSSGATEKINIFEEVNLSSAIQTLKENDFWVFAFDGDGKDFLNDEIKSFKKKVYIFGSEDKGISKNLILKSDFTKKLNINSKKIESLNVSNAVTSALSIIDFIESQT